MGLRICRTLPPAAAPLAIRDILSGVGGLLWGGRVVERFEQELKEFFGSRHCFALSSGKAALMVILQALHELAPDRNEVLIPAYTCYSVPSAIVRAGLVVRLCDLAPDSLDFDFHLLAAELDNPRLLCVIPTHLFGVAADVTRLRNLVAHRKIVILEDAAQAMGGESPQGKLGTLGDVGIFSLGRGKALSTVEGGVILTSDPHIAAAIRRRLKGVSGYSVPAAGKLVVNAVALTLLIAPRIYWLPRSLPFLKLGETRFEPDFPVRRLSPFQAGVARRWRVRLQELRAARARNVARILAGGVTIPGGGEGAASLLRFPLLAPTGERRESLLRESDRLGLGLAPGYPDAIDGIAELRERTGGGAFPVAKELAARLVSLPVHPLVTEADVSRIMELLV